LQTLGKQIQRIMISNCLICIPDLTGFTRFVSDADINFSRKVVPPILRAIINSNKTGFQLGEVEGDAVLFYVFEPFPNLQQLYNQCIFFLENFRGELDRIKAENPEEYNKYLNGNKLGLKIVIHSGLTSPEKIDTRTKLIGEDVIKAHRLLKNSVKENEYILFSENFLSGIEEEEIAKTFEGTKLIKGRDYYEHVGMIPYRYIPFNHIDLNSPVSGAQNKQEAKDGNDKSDKK
jgi:hypothetical protein